MFFIYNVIVHITWFHLKLIAFFHPKIKLFVAGRKHAFSTLENAFSKTDDTIWVHVASLGEFEQGLPVIEKLKAAYPAYKILVTFFSPSGYEVKKNTVAADVVTYLPMDTKANVKRFLNSVRPQLAIFVKYEIWPNYLKELKKQEVPTLLISAIFKRNQIYFRGFGGFMRKALRAFTHIFVQDSGSKKLLESIFLKNVSISGDTRFDRVSEISERDNSLSFMHRFKGDKPCFVAGSTWPEDESILVEHINTSERAVKYVLAPHTIKSENIDILKKSISRRTVLHSEMEGRDLSTFDVLLIDTIGLLTKIYSYADMAYVGGGFATGLHNTLEPAVFGIPVIIGPNYYGFKEAEDLVAQKGILVVKEEKDFSMLVNRLLEDVKFRNKTGQINVIYVSRNKGASTLIMDFVRTLL